LRAGPSGHLSATAGVSLAVADTIRVSDLAAEDGVVEGWRRTNLSAERPVVLLSEIVV